MNTSFRHLMCGVSLFACVLLLGCGQSATSSSTSDDASASGMPGMAKMKFPAPADMKFKDNIDSNAEAPKNIGELAFTNPDGSETKLSDYAGKKNVILVFTEGFNGMLCPFCKTQTSRLVSNYDKFQGTRLRSDCGLPGVRRTSMTNLSRLL